MLLIRGVISDTRRHKQKKRGADLRNERKVVRIVATSDHIGLGHGR